MNRIAAVLLSSLALAGSFATIASAETRANKPVLMASLEGKNTKTGWLAVLSEDKPKKKKQVKTNIHISPIPRQLIDFSESVEAGTIIVDNSDRRLYHVLGNGTAVAYGISVGRDGFIWTGAEKVTAKAEWPTWNPPAEMRRREAKKGHILPKTMKGGINNPLGARALYLGSTEYRIHGTNQPSSIGHAMSSGCIRMANEDVEHLYAQVTLGTQVIVRD